MALIKRTLGFLVLLAGLFPIATVELSTGAAAGGNPTFSATGVCFAGSPELELTFFGLPANQQTTVLASLYTGDDILAESQSVTVSPASPAVLWRSPILQSGSYFLTVQWQPVGALDAINLPIDWPLQSVFAVTLPPCGPAPPTFVGLADTPDGGGYWQATADGQVLAYGDAKWFGSMSGMPLNHPIVAMAATPHGNGYWLVASDGGVFSFGDARFSGSTGSLVLNQPVVGMASSRDGSGYWLVAADGGVFAFGDARFQGSMGSTPLNEPVVGVSLDPDTGGYWLVASDGGIFSFDAPFYGSTGSLMLNRPVVGMATASGNGYWLVANDGGIFTFGSIGFFGSLGSSPPSHPVVSMVPAPNDGGYTMIDSLGVVYPFGSAPFVGSFIGPPVVT